MDKLDKDQKEAIMKLDDVMVQLEMVKDLQKQFASVSVEVCVCVCVCMSVSVSLYERWHGLLSSPDYLRIIRNFLAPFDCVSSQFLIYCTHTHTSHTLTVSKDQKEATKTGKTATKRGRKRKRAKGKIFTVGNKFCL